MAIPGTIDGFVARGLNAPTSEMSADKSVFYGITAKKGDKMFYVVWRQYQDGRIERAWLSQIPQQHRGVLKAEASGALVVTIYEGEGDDKPTERYIVPGFKPFVSSIPDLARQLETFERELASLRGAVTELEQRPAGGGGNGPFEALRLALKAWINS